MNEETSSATALPRCRRLVEEREENGGFKTNVVNEGVTGGLVKDLVNEEDSEPERAEEDEKEEPNVCVPFIYLRPFM